MSRATARSFGALLALALLLGAGCGRAAETSTGPGPGSTGTGPPGAAPGTTPPAPPTTTCGRGPATTTPFDKGGGAITCSTVPGESSATSPPRADTTVPVPGPSPLTPDPTHGVLRGSVGGSPCPISAQQCIASYRFVPASVEARGPVRSTTHTDGMAVYQMLLPPGHYDVVATSDGPDDCIAGAADVTAGQVTELSVNCNPRA